MTSKAILGSHHEASDVHAMLLVDFASCKNRIFSLQVHNSAVLGYIGRHRLLRRPYTTCEVEQPVQLRLYLLQCNKLACGRNHKQDCNQECGRSYVPWLQPLRYTATEHLSTVANRGFPVRLEGRSQKHKVWSDPGDASSVGPIGHPRSVAKPGTIGGRGGGGGGFGRAPYRMRNHEQLGSSALDM